MEKYYKPEPEEFCIGSTYYVLTNINDKGEFLKEDAYVDIKIHSFVDYHDNFNLYYDDVNELYNISPPEDAVMKYLDERDILLLGFDKRSPNRYYKNQGLITQECFIITIPTKENEYYKIEKSLTLNRPNDTWNVFVGAINNKHELEVILKQIGVK